MKGKGAIFEGEIGQSRSKSVLFTPRQVSPTLGVLEQVGSALGRAGDPLPVTLARIETRRWECGLGSRARKDVSFRQVWEEGSEVEWRESRRKECVYLWKWRDAMIHCGEWPESPFNQHTQCLYTTKALGLEVSFYIHSKTQWHSQSPTAGSLDVERA